MKFDLNLVCNRSGNFEKLTLWVNIQNTFISRMSSLLNLGPSSGIVWKNFIQILSRFYPDIIQILSRSYLIQILSSFFRNSFCPNFIQILSWFYLDKIWMTSGWNQDKIWIKGHGRALKIRCSFKVQLFR